MSRLSRLPPFHHFELSAGTFVRIQLRRGGGRGRTASASASLRRHELIALITIALVDMAYDALAHVESAGSFDSPTSYPSASPHAQMRNLAFPTDCESSGGSPAAHEASVSDNGNGASLSSMMRSMISASSSYEMIGSDEHEGTDARSTGRGRGSAHSSINEHYGRGSSSERGPNQLKLPKRGSHQTSLKTVSREGSIPMRHPTPDLQSLQGAYVGNVERLERSAERLSMSSDIGEELRKLRLEQKRSDSRRNSRRSSMLDTHAEDEELPPLKRDFTPSSNASNSIIGLNNAARSGAFSSGGFATSPQISLRTGSWSHNSVRARSGSQKSRLTQMPEPEQEGRPLDSPLSTRSIPTIGSPKTPMQVLRVINHNEPSQELPPSDHQYCNVLQPPDSASHGLLEPASETLERSMTPSSMNTDPFRKTSNLFADFDGVHISTPPPPNPETSAGHVRQTSLGHLPIVPRPQSYAAPVGENMVFYPAPVPMTLNLPQKLSKLPPANQKDKRRSQVLNHISSDARQTTARLPEMLENVDEGNQNDHNSTSPKVNAENRKSIPAQLRASIFFEHQAIPQTIQVKENSAVATLDSILEASAFAPINAFIDHPIVGSIGAEIYSNPTARPSSGSFSGDRTEQRKNRSSMNLAKNRRASSYLPTNKGRPDSSLLVDIAAQHPHMLDEAEAAAASGEHTPLQQGTPGHDGPEEDREDREFYDAPESFEDDEEYGHHPEELEYNGPPTTLLAELQMRKLQQKQRTRTAATAFPNGMHSTLLELDAVAQVQRQTRRQKHITLAWEDPSTTYAGAENEDDEDIPLGMLFPGRKVAANEDAGRTQPVGLIQRRDVDDNEPLSQRRARLRGDGPIPQRSTSPDKRASMYTLDLPGLQSAETPVGTGAEDGETLAQRIKRLKGQADTKARPISGDFATEILSQFGAVTKPVNKDTSNNSPGKPTDPEDETLGQRRKRLQAEQEVHLRQASSGSAPEPHPPFARPTVPQQRSTTDLLPSQPPYNYPTPSYGLAPLSTTYPQPNTYGALAPPFPQQPHLPIPPLQYPTSIAHTPFPTAFAGVQSMPAFHNGMGLGIGMGVFQTEMPLDVKQRDMIDQWRQSVMH